MPHSLEVHYFDGRSARAHRARVHLAAGILHVTGEGVTAQWPVREVRWPERTRHGARIAHLPDGATLQALSSADWDSWVQAQGLHDSTVVRWQQSWGWALSALGACAVLLGAGVRWGLPALAAGAVALTPPSVDRQVGRIAWESLEDHLLDESCLAAAEQARLTQVLTAAAARADLHAGREPVDFRVMFRRTPIGPNALALPDGTILITDELVTLLRDRDDVLVGVFGHELGHVRHRHSMRLLVQSGLAGAAASLLLGDFSTVLAGAPALLTHLAYSRDHEREADDEAVDFLRANGLRPSVMATLFERLQAHAQGADPDGGTSSCQPEDPARASKAPTTRQKAEEPTDAETGEDHGSREDSGFLGIALRSHPADAERIKRFQDADRR